MLFKSHLQGNIFHQSTAEIMELILMHSKQVNSDPLVACDSTCCIFLILPHKIHLKCYYSQVHGKKKCKYTIQM